MYYFINYSFGGKYNKLDIKNTTFGILSERKMNKLSQQKKDQTDKDQGVRMDCNIIIQIKTI